FARPGDDIKEGARSAKRVRIERAVGQEDLSRPAHHENIGPLVYKGAQFELLGRHKSRGAEHASHLIAERTFSVIIKVHNPETPGLEIVDQATVVEVDRDPTGACKLVVQIKDGVEAPLNRGCRQASKSLECGFRIISPGARRSDKFAVDPLVDKQRAGRRL